MTNGSTHSEVRRGAVAVIVVIVMSILVGFAALAVDVGVMINTRIDIQRAAEAAAMAAAGVMADTDLGEDNRLELATDMAIEMVESNPALGRQMTLDPELDVVFGHSNYDPESNSFDFEPSLEDPDAVRVTVRSTEGSPNGPTPLFFAAIFGRDSTNQVASATAGIVDEQVCDCVCIEFEDDDSAESDDSGESDSGRGHGDSDSGRGHGDSDSGHGHSDSDSGEAGHVVPSGKTMICHIPPGNPDNAHTIAVSNMAVPAHLAHGDELDMCPDEDDRECFCDCTGVSDDDSDDSGDSDSGHGHSDSDSGDSDSGHGHSDSDSGNGDSGHGHSDSDSGESDSGHGHTRRVQRID